MTSHRFNTLFGLVTCALGTAGCALDGAPEDPDDTAVASDPIQAGQLETGYPSVGRIVSSSGPCTGTLISPSYVLTARHCTGNNMVFKTGTSSADFVDHTVDQQVAHPTRDLLLAHLAAPITNIIPSWINEGALPAVGEICTAVGFGRHEENGITTSGIKRSATEQVISASASLIVVQMVSGIADHGDSGGPLLCSGRIAAVVFNHTDGDWPQHTVENYTTSDYDWIVHNAPRALGAGALGTVPGATALAAYYGGDDRQQHVIAGTAAGALTQYVFPGGGGILSGPLTSVGPEVALAGYYAPSDQYHHVIAAGTDGNIREVFFRPGGPVGQGILATVPGAVTLGAYYAPSDGYQHVMVGTSSGEIRELYFKPGSGLGVGSDTIGWVSGLVSVSAYYAPTDGYQHVIVGTSGGQIYEFYFRPGDGTGVHGGLLATVPSLLSVTGYYAPGDQRQHVIAAATDGTLYEISFPGFGGASIHDILTWVPGAQRVAGYTGNGYQHVIALQSSGQLVEAFAVP